MLNSDLEKKLNTLLDIGKYQDMCPNGLQVEGRPEIKKIVTGVSACVELFEEAIKRNADAILTHHGLIWNFEKPLYKGGYKKRVKLLLEKEINLFGYHLPLDGDPTFGNNAVIANLLDVQNIKPFDEYKGAYIGCCGTFENQSATEVFGVQALGDYIQKKFGIEVEFVNIHNPV